MENIYTLSHHLLLFSTVIFHYDLRNIEKMYKVTPLSRSQADQTTFLYLKYLQKTFPAPFDPVFTTKYKSNNKIKTNI